MSRSPEEWMVRRLRQQDEKIEQLELLVHAMLDQGCTPAPVGPVVFGNPTAISALPPASEHCSSNRRYVSRDRDQEISSSSFQKLRRPIEGDLVPLGASRGLKRKSSTRGYPAPPYPVDCVLEVIHSGDEQPREEAVHFWSMTIQTKGGATWKCTPRRGPGPSAKKRPTRMITQVYHRRRAPAKSCATQPIVASLGATTAKPGQVPVATHINSDQDLGAGE